MDGVKVLAQSELSDSGTPIQSIDQSIGAGVLLLVLLAAWLGVGRRAPKRLIWVIRASDNDYMTEGWRWSCWPSQARRFATEEEALRTLKDVFRFGTRVEAMPYEMGIEKRKNK